MTNTLTSILSVPVGTLVLFVMLLVVIALAVLVISVVQFGTRLRYLASPVYDHIVKEAQQKAQQILADAEERARIVKEKAEAEAEKAFATKSTEDEAFRKEQTKHIEDLATHAKELLNKQTVTISQLSESVASDFSKQAHAAQKELEGEVGEMKKTLADETKRMKDTFASMDVQVREDYQDLVKETRKKMEEELDNEVQSARDAVKAYRVERISLLNKEIVGLVEDTARLALRRSLSLDQHRDIILSALEEAKQQGLFTKAS
jgi:Tfp pilus assembly protein PilX